MREDRDTKAARLLSTGRVQITAVSPWHVEAIVRGDHGIYPAGYSSGSWHCECACLTGCSHVQALMLCTDPAAGLARQRVAS